jgi:hypothetical protein
MDLISLIVLVVVLGLVWWALTSFVPMPPAGKTILTVAFVVVLILALLSFLGIGTGMLHYKPHLG